MATSAGLHIGVGKRAGLASGLLGMLCVLAELCFLFPGLLVTKDAPPMYQPILGCFAASFRRASLRRSRSGPSASRSRAPSAAACSASYSVSRRS